jgi:hypothetical protein
MGVSDWMGKEWEQVKPRIRYDIYKWIVALAGASVIALAAIFMKSIREIPAPVFWGALFLLMLWSFVFLAYRLERHRPDAYSSGRKSKLVIHRAVYGVPGAMTDITQALQNAAKDGLVIPVDNGLVPTDPAKGIRKRLDVEYSYGDGIVCFVSRRESMQDDIVRLVLPQDSETARIESEIKQLKQEKLRPPS